jgi:hypothetical protein
MGAAFRASSWEVDVAPPWTAKDVGHCVEITQQPAGAGGLHISTARKRSGHVAESELRSMALDALPADTPVESVSFGDFRGLAGDYVDWGSSAYWKKWWLFSGPVLLHATYTCSRGDEEIEADDVERILSSLATR